MSEETETPTTEGISIVETETPVKLKHGSLVNNPTFSDIHFTNLIGKKTVYGHIGIISVRAPKLLQGLPKKKKGPAIRDMKEKIHDYTLLALLKYLYTDEIDLSKISITDLLHLNAATMEFEVNRLQWIIEDHLHKMITSENIFRLLKESHTFKQDRVKSFCLHYAVNHYNEVVGNKGGVEFVGIELFQEMVAANQEHSSGTLKPLEFSPCPPSTLISDFKQVYDTIDASEGETIFLRVGQEIKVFVASHRAILANASPQFHALCAKDPVPKNKNTPFDHYIVPPILTEQGVPGNDEISADAFASLLKYVYYGETNISPIPAAELVPFSGDFGLKELQQICLKIIAKNIKEDSALTILSICYLHQMAESQDVSDQVRKECLDFIVEHIAESDLRKLPKLDPRIAVDIVLHSQRHAQKQKGMKYTEISSLNISSPTLSRKESDRKGKKDPKKK